LLPEYWKKVKIMKLTRNFLHRPITVLLLLGPNILITLFSNTFYVCKKSKKVKLSNYMPWRHKGGEVQLLLILNLSTIWGVGGQHHAPAALYPRGKDPRYPWNGRLGGPQSWSTRRD
jgi:hypothetical protein